MSHGRHILHRWKPLKQGWGYLVDTRIGTLGRQDHSNEQLPGIPVVQFSLRGGYDLPQLFECALSTLSSTHQSGSIYT